NDIQRVSPPPTKEAIRTKVKNGDILISITAELGLIALAEELSEECFINQHIALVSIDGEKYDPYLASTFLCLPPCANQFNRFNDQGAKAGMNLKNVAKLKVPGLSRGEQKFLANRIRSNESLVSALATIEKECSTFSRYLISCLAEG
ncbi:MAG: hypothetical protein ABSD59_18265, partial [Terracidiphilus sp.]